VLGTAAVPEILKELPKSRVIAALDAVNGEVVVKGWTTKTGQNVFDKIQELKPYVAGFLVTFVEREGRMQGIDLDMAQKLKEAVGNDHILTVAGGVTTVEDVVALDKLGIEVCCQ
jgi:phosphoribosylformimino-5-aminoimidazole carboxamide ribonucleotide (ProFAR) isomerase